MGWFKRHPIWTGLIIIVIIAMLRAAFSSENTFRKSKLEADAMVLGTEIIIDNKNPFPWRKVRIKINPGTIDNGYYIDVNNIPENSQQSFSILRFANDDGERFNPLTKKVRQLLIKCETSEGEKLYGGWDFK